MQPNLQTATFQTSEVALSQHRVLRNTYALLAISMIPTVIGAFIGTNVIDFSFMARSPIIASLGFLAVVYGLFFAIEKNKNSSVGVWLLLALTLILGVMLGPILQVALKVSGATIIAMAFGGTALTFFAMAAIATVSKRDFGFLTNFLIVGGIVLMIAVLANIFLHLPAMALAISAGFILFSSVAILFTVNQIIRGGETNYISATLTLYMSIYNIFVSLLNILMSLTGQRE